MQISDLVMMKHVLVFMFMLIPLFNTKRRSQRCFRIYPKMGPVPEAQVAWAAPYKLDVPSAWAIDRPVEGHVGDRTEPIELKEPQIVLSRSVTDGSLEQQRSIFVGISEK